MEGSNNPAGDLITSKDWTLEHLLATGERFRPVDSISAKSVTPEQIALTIKDYEERDVPLVVQDLHLHPNWPELFTPRWLETHYGSQVVEVRNVHGDRLDRESTITELIDSLRNAPPFAHQGERERLYGKDMHCPSEWRDWIKSSGVLPSVVIPGATGDVLPETVETLMSYLGISDTFTPLHKDPCASYGQNIMCYTEDEGHSFWFMTNPSDCSAVADHFWKFGHELDWEDHVATLEELTNAPFDVYIWEQKLGDLVLIPPRSFHQVVNAGGITIKASWSRMSIRSLEIALYHELPIYRRVCRSETYRVKRTIYDTLIQRTTALESSMRDTPDPTYASVNPLCREVARLIELLDDVLEQEYCTQFRRLRQVTNSFAPEGPGHVCDFCGADIFLSFFQCDSCSSRDGSGGPVCLCPTCVVEGRMCKCRSMEPVQSGSFRDLLRNRNNAMLKLQEAHGAEFYEEEPESLSDQHLIDSVKITFQAAWLLLEKRRDILNSQKTTRVCTLARKNVKSHVVDGWAMIMCKECHSGKCFTHILEAGIHSSEALLTVELDKTHGKWHSIHTNRQKHYDDAVPPLISAARQGDKTEIDQRLVYFARTFQTPRPLSKWVSLGFYDKELPDPEELDQLDPTSVTNSKHVTPEITEVPPVLYLPHSDPPDVPATTETSRKRKRSSQSSSLQPEPNLPSQQPVVNQGGERSSQAPRPSKRWVIDCVLITTLPPVPHKKTSAGSSQGGGRSRTKDKKHGRKKQRGKQREVVSVPSDSRSLHSRSHSVSSLRPPLFEPEMSPAPTHPDFDEEHAVKVEPGEDNSDDEVYVAFPSRRRRRVEIKSPTSIADVPPPSSSESSAHPENLPYYTIVSTKYRPPGSGIRFAPNQRQIAKTPAMMYSQSQVRQPVAGPSHPTTRVGPPKPRLPDRSAPKLRPAAEVPPPRPPPPHPGLAALEAKMNTFVEENKKLRDELVTAKDELTAAKSELAAALTRVDTVERGLHGLEALETKLEEMNGDYERLSNLLSSEHLFDSERFRTNIQAVVKNSFGYYWPSAKNDMKNQLWKELPPIVKEFVEKEVGKVANEIALIRSELATVQPRSTTGGGVQNGDTVMAGIKQAIERVEKMREESEGAISKAETAQEPERSRRGSTPSVPKLTPNNAENVHPPHLPPKPPSPWLDNPHQGPQRRGAQTPSATSDQNSYPFHQGLDEEAGDPVQTGPTQDPRRSARRSSAVPSLSPLTLVPNPTSPPCPGSVLSQSVPTLVSSGHAPPLILAPQTLTLSSASRGMHPSRVAQLGANNPAIITNTEPPVLADLTPGPQQGLPTRPVAMSRSESAPSITTQFPAGMHPDRIALLSAHDRPSPTVSSTRSPLLATPDDSQPHPLLGERSVERSPSLPTSPSGTDAAALPLNAPTSFNSNHQHTPTEVHNNTNQRPNWGGGAQKRKASEILLPPNPPKSPKIQKVGKWKPGNGTIGVSGAAQTKGKFKKRNRRGKKKKAKPVIGQPGPLVEAEDNRGDRGVEDGEIEDGETHAYDEPESGEEFDYDPAHPYGAESTWGLSGPADDTHDPLM